MFGNTTDSSQLTTTSSLRKTDGTFLLGSVPANKSPSQRPDLVGKQFGWVVVTGPDIRWREKLDRKGHKGGWREVHTRCSGCGTEKWIALENLLKGKSRGCQSCSHPRVAPKWLERRMSAAKSRCTVPTTPGWENYGGRGIEFRFSSPTAGAVWVMQNLGLHKHLEVDRIDNNGHYEAGNLKYSTKSEQMRNQRRSKIRELPNWPSPYSPHTTARLLRAGFSEDEIMAMAVLAVAERRKNWRGIAERLASMTS